MAAKPEYRYDGIRSLYGNLTKMIEFYYGSGGFLSNADTVRKLLWLIKEGTGINYAPEGAVDVARVKSYSEGYETGCVETRRAYEGKRYTEAEMDKHGQYKYQEGYEEGKRVQEAVKRSITPLFPTEAAVTVVYDNGYRDGVEEGKRQYDWLRKQAEAKYKDLKVKYDKLEQEIKAIERCADAAYDKGYLNGCQEAEEKCAAQRQLRYQQGYDQGIKDSWDKLTGAIGYTQGLREGYEKGIEKGTKGKEKFATDRAEEAYSKGYRIGLEDGIRQGKKEVVDFINNMKVSQ